MRSLIDRRRAAARSLVAHAWVLAGLLAVGWLPAAACAQQAAVRATPAARVGPFRAIVPGVEITIPPDRQEEETYTRADIVEILRGIPGLDWGPKFASTTQTLRSLATQTEFRRNIWCLEFTFKPVRMIWVDVPQLSGRAQRKLIWYLMYHVKNTGKHLAPVKQEDGTYALSTIDMEPRFFPQFVIESDEYRKAYLDRIIPTAIAAIQQKEDPNRKLLNSVEIGAKRIPLSSELVDHSVWGVATWEDIDPRIDTFSILVEGLSNAYRWIDKPDQFSQGDPPGKGRVLLEKTLLLNFWRPGDEFVEDQRVIRFGSPGKVDSAWVYR